jgi:myo-inositol-1-phosphate synthase
MIILIRYEPCIVIQCSGVLFVLSDPSVWSKFLVSEILQTANRSLETHVEMHDKANCKPLIVAAVRRLYIMLTRVTFHRHGSVTKLIHYCLGTVTTAIKFLLFPRSQTQRCTFTIFSNLFSHPPRHTRTFWSRQS